MGGGQGASSGCGGGGLQLVLRGAELLAQLLLRGVGGGGGLQQLLVFHEAVPVFLSRGDRHF